jgi:hypothetical protein
MSDLSPDPKAVPQFATAEYASKTSQQTCAACKTAIDGRYYRVNGMLSCEHCTARSQLPADSHTRFVRGILFGIGGAVLGLIVYSVFGIVTGLVIGYLSLAVGYIVGKAIKLGSHGSGGRRYQVAAVLLTYAAVSLSAIPMAIFDQRKSAADESGSAQHVQQKAPPGVTSAQPAPSTMAPGQAIAYLALLGLASPFLGLQDPFHGVIGLIILSVGIRIAWRLTAGTDLQILGPFDSRQRTSAAATL